MANEDSVLKGRPHVLALSIHIGFVFDELLYHTCPSTLHLSYEEKEGERRREKKDVPQQQRGGLS